MRMRVTLRNLPATLMALLYVLAGVASVWHAPHFTEGEIAVHSDRHTGGHEAASLDECVLCTWKSAAQEFSSKVPPVAVSVAFAPVRVLRPELPVVGHFRAALARGPPSLS